MDFSKDLKEQISTWFENIPVSEHPVGLYEPIKYTLASGGKRIRPTLLLAAVKAFGGRPEDARNACLGIEMFHNFTLLHDDVMDKSEVRRGRPTVHMRWNENTAILSGDTMLSLANQLISECADKHLREVLHCFNKTAIEVYEGQQLDMDFEKRQDVAISEYIEMIRLKTSVLLGCSLRIGSIIADAPLEAKEALYAYGINIGLGFQLRDDYLDTFGDTLIFGKQIGRDIVNNKKTWLMISAVERDKSGIMKLALENRFEDNEKIEKVTAAYSALELDKEILALIRSYSQKAKETILPVKMNEQAKQYFLKLADSLIDRKN